MTPFGIAALAMMGVTFVGALAKAFWDKVKRGAESVEEDARIAEMHQHLGDNEHRTLDEHHDIEWSLLPIELRRKAVGIIRENLWVYDARLISEAYEVGLREEFWAAQHHFFGMAVRNVLRRKGIRDDQLPTGGWDDYYQRAVEVAVGLMPLETAHDANAYPMPVDVRPEARP